MFRARPDTMFRLDIWHFMRRFTVGCTTDAHQLFLGRPSQCIFEYSKEDLDALIAAKRPEMETVSIRTPSDGAASARRSWLSTAGDRPAVLRRP